MNLVNPDGIYGIALEEVDSGQRFEFLLNKDETGQGQFSFRKDGEVVESDPVLTYDFTQSERPYNSVSVRVVDSFIAFIINDQEEVYVYQAADSFSPGWRLGLQGGSDGHAIIGSAYLYKLNPVQ